MPCRPPGCRMPDPRARYRCRMRFFGNDNDNGLGLGRKTYSGRGFQRNLGGTTFRQDLTWRLSWWEQASRLRRETSAGAVRCLCRWMPPQRTRPQSPSRIRARSRPRSPVRPGQQRQSGSGCDPPRHPLRLCCLRLFVLQPGNAPVELFELLGDDLSAEEFTDALLGPGDGFSPGIGVVDDRREGV